MKKEADYLLKNGLPCQVTIFWSIALKSDGTPHFCTDFQEVDEITEADCFSLPRIEDSMDSAGTTLSNLQIRSVQRILAGYANPNGH